MRLLKTTGALAIVALSLTLAGNANATTYDFSGSITTCTATCNSFPALAAGSVVQGSIDINTSPNGTWGFADVGAFLYTILNTGEPINTDPSIPALLNPLPLTDTIAPVRATGGVLPATGGTTDANNDLSSGIILHEFAVAPFSDNGAWAVFSIASGGAATIDVCLFASALGCDPTVSTFAVRVEGQFTQAPVPVPAAVWLFGSALLGVVGVRRRRTA